MKKVYLKGLTELRAIAAFFVVFHHIELYKKREGFSSLFNTFLSDFIAGLGKNGVYIFFILSGFLISYLLLIEKNRLKKIDVKKFYVRRILRIWPLYYFIVFISFAIIPLLANNIEALQNESYYYGAIKSLQDSPYTALILFLLFLPNLAVIFAAPVVGASQAWSVGVEEQFYLIWPHLFNKINKVSIFIIVLTLISLLPAVPYIISFFSESIAEWATHMINILSIHYMAIGSIGAFLLFYKNATLMTVLKSPLLFLVNTALFIGGLFYMLPWFLFGSIVALQILFIVQDGFRFNLRSQFLEKLGNISYGVYMYHPMIMYGCFAIFNSVFPVQDVTVYNVLIYISIILITIIISSLSYKYFENWFIKLKKTKYTVIRSGK